MCCGKKRERWIVQLPNGQKVTKASESQAERYAAAHPGATYSKVS
jgi:hypothetical protein